MRYIIGIVLVALLGWCLWWWVAAAGQRTAWERLLDHQRAMGREAEAQVSVKGFPNRIDTTLLGVSMLDNQRGWGWEAPFFQVLMLSYKPNHIIAAWPPNQTITTPIGEIEVTSEQLQASAIFAAETDLGLERFNLDGAALSASGALSAALPRLMINTTRNDGAPERYDVLLEARQPIVQGLALERIRGDLTLVFDAPLDRHAATGKAPRFDGAIIRSLRLERGDDTVETSGEIGVDANGFAEGVLQLQAARLDQIPAYLNAIGIRLDVDPTVLALLSRATSGSGPITIDLAMRGGVIEFGPLRTKVGRAPRLR